jgi:hypothetical protein
MSTFTECIACVQQPITLEVAAQFVIVEDTDGTKYWNVQFNERGSCGEYSPGVDCISPQTFAELFFATIVEDECGNCAINILGNCDNA